MIYPRQKALGCVWETGGDRLRIVSSLKPLTKYIRRTMLSQLGKSFDTLGVFSPFFVKARLVLQRLAIEKYDWDDDVPESIVEEWKAWFQLLGFLLDTSLARYYFKGLIPHHFYFQSRYCYSEVHDPFYSLFNSKLYSMF